MEHDVARAVSQAAPSAKELLIEALAIPSVSGSEGPVTQFLHEQFRSLGLDASLVPVGEDIRNDPDYTHMYPDRSFEGRSNLLVERKGTGTGRSVILQTHVDVVAPDTGWDDAFVPREDGDVIHARGACDAKGQIATIFLALKALDILGVELAGDIRCHLVIEEESGGNGALEMIRQGHLADAAVVLEPTCCRVHPANRGAVWFQLTVTGRSVHMGRTHEGVNAIDKAYEAIRCMRAYYDDLTARSRGYRQFEGYEYPVQLCIGMINGGTHPSAVAGEVTVEGGGGFLPNISMEQVKQDLHDAIASSPDEWLRSHFELRFNKLHNDSFEFPAGHPLPVALSKACRGAGLAGEVTGWNVSCDARLYAKRAKIPTVVFGPGDIVHAHSAREQIRFSEIQQAAESLVHFLLEWCEDKPA